MTNTELEQKLLTAVKQETKLKIEILHLLSEVERRRLYAKDYPSLFEYCVKVLKYSGSAAQRRIDSMRAMKLMPEIEEKFTEGSLNLSTVSLAQSFFRNEKKAGKTLSLETKKQILEKLENKSTRECLKELAAISPMALPAEKRRELTETRTEIKIVADKELIEKLDQIKAFLSHTNPNMTDRELIEKLADIALQKLDPAKKKLLPASVVKSKNPRYIPSHIKQAVYIRDQGKCQICKTNHLLEYDHIIPVAYGGQATTENVRLLCKTHNLEAARQKG